MAVNEVVAGSKSQSVYKPSQNQEFSRLKLQAEQTLTTDLENLNRIYTSIGKESDLIILDYGCADGEIARTRFLNDERVSLVLGFDVDEKAIERAKEKNIDNDKLHFFLLNDGENPKDDIKDALLSHNIEEVDVVYISLVLHHLRRPISALRTLRRFVTSGGYIFARSPDDGSEFAYPDHSGLVEQIIARYAETLGTSDRYAGRKLYHQFRNIGLEDIHIERTLIDTTGFSYEERLDAFEKFFSYRLNVYKSLLEENPENSEYKAQYAWMKEALEDLEDEFAEDSFWFCLFDFTATGRKP